MSVPAGHHEVVLTYHDPRIGQGLMASSIVWLAFGMITLQELSLPCGASIHEGAPVTVTFDAIPGLELPGKVKRIDAFGKNTRGDITYTVVIAPDRQDERLRWNMTASVAITP